MGPVEIQKSLTLKFVPHPVIAHCRTMNGPRKFSHLNPTPLPQIMTGPLYTDTVKMGNYKAILSIHCIGLLRGSRSLQQLFRECNDIGNIFLFLCTAEMWS